MQPHSPSPEFDFMLKDQKPAKRGLPMPNLPKPVKIAVAGMAALILIIIAASLLSSRNQASSQAFANLLARGQETIRVTATVQQLNPQDPQTDALAATVTSSLTSDQKQFIHYLSGINIKLSTSQLAIDTDKTTDASLQTAAQNNQLDAAYVAYLKDALTKYGNDLQAASQHAGPNGQKLLKTSEESVRTLMNSAPIKT
jgi:hypothetical protein